jgi:ABC-type glutathione transport system ATPase component
MTSVVLLEEYDPSPREQLGCVLTADVATVPGPPGSSRKQERPLKGKPMASITINQITKRYGSVCAVDNLSFSLQAGSITGFVGANGAGKSTTLRILLG